MDAQGSSSTPARTGSQYLTLAAMVFAVAMTFIDQTIVTIASPEIQRELGLTDAGVQWVVNGYLIALAALFALGGRLSDILGHRRMVLIGVVVFAGASFLCGITPTGSFAEAWIVTFRVVQGAGAAIMFPAALAIVVASFDIGERGRALAIFFGISGGLTAVGPILGGYLTQWTWRAIFWVNLPVALIAIVLTLRAHIHTQHTRQPIDWRGAVLIAAGMGLSVFGLQQASRWGWDSATTWACIGAGLLILAVFVLVELRTEVPLINLRIFRSRAFTVDNAVLFFANMAFVPVFLFASLYAQFSLGYDANNAGFYLLLIFAGFSVAAQIGGRMLDSRGAKLPVTLGCALGAVGFVLWARTLRDLDLSGQWPYIVMAGAGIGFLLGPASTDAVNRSIGASYGEVTGITQTVRNYGASLGIAVLGTLLININTNRLTTSLTDAGVPAGEAGSLAHELAQGSGGATGKPPAGASSLPQAVQERLEATAKLDFAEATQYVLYGMAVALAIAFVFALLHPGGRAADTATDPATTGAERTSTSAD